MDVHPYRLQTAGPPFSPWLRLAHLWRVGAEAPPVESTPLRRLRDWEIFLQLEGSTWFAVPAAGGHVPLPAGSLALIPPGLIHGWAHLPGCHLAVHFDLHAAPGLEPMEMIDVIGERSGRGPACAGWRWDWVCGDEARSLPLVINLTDVDVWERRLRPLLALYGERRHRGQHAALTACGILGRAIADLLALAGDHRPDPLLDLLARAAARPLSDGAVAMLAREAGLGETAFRSAVRRLTGHGPREHLERLRMERAAYALRLGDEPIAAIATAVGYHDPFHFSRAFRRIYGCAPSDYRHQVDAKA